LNFVIKQVNYSFNAVQFQKMAGDDNITQTMTVSQRRQFFYELTSFRFAGRAEVQKSTQAK
jgi:hypothetical protein